MKRLLFPILVVAALLRSAGRSPAQTNLNSLSLHGTVVIPNAPPQGGGSGAGVSPAGYYVDFQSGSDSNAGTNPASAWKHCPGDGSATGVAASTLLTNSCVVYFNPSSTYVLTKPCPNGSTPNACGCWAGIVLASGGAGHPITYDGGLTNWASGRATITDNGSSNNFAGFGPMNGVAVSNFVIKNFKFSQIGGGASLPADTGPGIGPNPGFAIYFPSAVNNGTIDGCFMEKLGWWQITKPIGGSSVDGEGIHLSIGASNLTITNCEITKCHTAITLQYGTLSNVEVVACDIHDYIVWGIDIATSGNSWSDYLQIHGNKFHGIGWAYASAWYTGYDAGAYHQDIIFDRACTTCGTSTAFTGTNRNIYANTFYEDQHPNGAVSAYIYLSDTLSANVYNNLFLANVLIPSPPHVIGFTCDTTSTNYNLVRILNNTFILNGCDAYSWDDTHGGNIWQTNTHVLAENNILCQTSTIYPPWCADIDGTCTNYGQEKIAMTLNYNCYTNPAVADYFHWTNETNVAGMRSQFGFELNGIQASPGFADISHGFGLAAISNNYALATNSPCLNAGANLTAIGLPGLAFDITGFARTNAWDIGAYQH